MSDTPAPVEAAERLTVETPESVAFSYALAGLGSRGIALALDMLMVGLLIVGEVAAVAAMFGIAYLLQAPPNAMLVALWWAIGFVVLAAFVTYWGYFVYGEVLRNGRTWGKRRVGIRVVRDDGSRVSALDSIIRNLMRIVDILPGNYAVGMAAILISKRNKRIGDMAAGTVVVRDSGELPTDFDTAGRPANIVLAHDFLTRRASLTEAARMQVGTAVLRTFAEEPGEGWDEPTLAGRIADLSGWRRPVETLSAEGGLGSSAKDDQEPAGWDEMAEEPVSPNDPDDADPFWDARG